MDITPFENVFSTVSTFQYIVVAMSLVGGTLLIIAANALPVPTRMMGAIIIMVGLLLTETMGALEYKLKQVEVIDYVTSLGLEVKQGTPNLFANNDSMITVSKYGQDYECTVYAPSDPNEKIFFVCDSALGYGRGDIEDLAENAKESTTSMPVPSNAPENAVEDGKVAP